MSSETSPLLSRPGATAPPSAHPYILHRTIFYQATSLLSAVDGLFGAYALKTLKTREAYAAAQGAVLDASRGVWAAGFILTVAGTFAGLACGISFVLMTIAPGQRESKRTVFIREIAFGLFSLLLLAGSIYSTVVVATGAASLNTQGWTKHARAQLVREIGGHLEYRYLTSAVLFVVFGWLTWAAMVFSLALVSLSSRRQLLLGPAVTAKQALPERLARRFLEPRLRFLGLGLWVEPLKDDNSEAAAEPPVVVVSTRA